VWRSGSRRSRERLDNALSAIAARGGFWKRVTGKPDPERLRSDLRFSAHWLRWAMVTPPSARSPGQMSMPQVFYYVSQCMTKSPRPVLAYGRNLIGPLIKRALSDLKNVRAFLQDRNSEDRENHLGSDGYIAHESPSEAGGWRFLSLWPVPIGTWYIPAASARKFQTAAKKHAGSRGSAMSRISRKQAGVHVVKASQRRQEIEKFSANCKA